MAMEKRLDKLCFWAQRNDVTIPVTLSQQYLEQMDRGVCSPPNEINADLVHLGLAHTNLMERDYAPCDVYVRTVVYAPQGGEKNDSAPQDQLLGPTKSLELGRMRVLVVDTEEEMCTCGQQWINNKPCDNSTLEYVAGQGSSAHGKLRFSTKVHILYDDFNACLVTESGRPLYISKWDLKPNWQYLTLPLPMVATPVGEKRKNPIPKTSKSKAVKKKKKDTPLSSGDVLRAKPTVSIPSLDVTFSGNLDTPFLTSSDVNAFFADL